MLDIPLIVFLVVLALGCGTVAGAGFEQNKYAKGFVALTLAFVATSFLAIGTHMYNKRATLLWIAPVDEKVYVVLKKVPDEQGAFLVLLDTKNNNERVAHLSAYPPEGYTETVIPDGRVVLAVTGKQIVVGDPDKTDFVPSVKVVPPPKG